MEKEKDTVLICCDDKEMALAKKLRDIISTIFQDLTVNLCIPGASKWIQHFSSSNQYRFIFFLCSPYSIAQKWINFISGMATLFVDEAVKKSAGESTRIIPLCHSGQKSKDLPHYLMSRQALELENDRFIESLLAILTPQPGLRKYDLSEFNEEEFHSGKAEALCAAIRSFYPDELNVGDPVAWLNKKLEDPFLYERLKLNAEEYYILQDDYRKYKRLKDLKELNRRHLEILYDAPKRTETPQSLRKKIGDALKDLAKPLIFNRQSEVGPADGRQKTYKLVKEDDTVSISILEGGDSERAQISRMNDFLKGETNNIEGVGISAGVQNCLYDGEGIYVGMRIAARVDRQFRSFCESKRSLFEPGYGLWPNSGGTLQDLFINNEEKYEKRYIATDEMVRQIIEERLKATGAKLWTVRLPGSERTAAATIFANTSTSLPRYEIGIWKFINIKELKHKKEEQIPDFGTDGYDVRNNEIVYWIWVRDGQIFYWSFPEEESIPRRYLAGTESGSREVLVPADYMNKVYGRPEKYTPFAPDDLLGVGDVVKENFSAAARMLLSMF